MQQRDIFDTQISVFTTSTTLQDGKLFIQGWKHHVRTIGQYINAAKTHYAATIDNTRSILNDAFNEWSIGNVENYNALMEQYKFCKWQCPIALMQGVNPDHNNETTKFESFSDVLCIDIDAPKPDQPSNGNEWISGNLDYLKKQFAKVPYVAYCGLSAGGKGLFLLVPIASHEHHKEHWEMLRSMFRKYFNLEIDAATHNIGRLRFMSYDDEAVINHHAVVFDKLPPPPKPKQEQKKVFVSPARMESSSDTEERIIKAVNEIAQRGIDITQSYDEWIKASAAIAHEMGERGRSLFHTIASQSEKYRESENEKLYTNIMRNANSECSINSFFYLCKQYGIDIKHDGTPSRAKRMLPPSTLKRVPAEPRQCELPSTLQDAAECILSASTSSMSKAETMDLQRQWEQIKSDTDNLASIRKHNPAVDLLCNKLDLHYNGNKGWKMTDAQFKHINNL